MSNDAKPIKEKKEKKEKKAKRPREEEVEVEQVEQVKEVEAVPSGDNDEPSFDIPPPGTEDKNVKKKNASSSKGKGKDVEGTKDGEGGDEAMEEKEEESEEPALSHKERRLAKRRKLAGLDEEGKKLPKATPTINGVTVGHTPAKEAHGVWIGNLTFKTSARMLLGWFADRGLKETTRINMPNGRRAGEFNKGFAYLDFPTATDVEIAVGLSEQHLDGRKLLIKSSSDFSGRPAAPTTSSSSSVAPLTLNKTARKILDRQKNAPGPTLFIGNLGFETTVDNIRDMFDAHQKAAGAWAPKESKGEEGEKKMEVEGEAEAEKEGEEVDEDAGSGSDSEDSEAEGEEAEEVKSNDGSDTEGEDGEEEKKVKKPKVKRDKGPSAPKDLTKAKDAGIRKIRLGTFEDTGKCKGWAFVDFHLAEQCTRALTNVRNHSLNGRSLVVEYASADAVRRGQVGTRAAITAGSGRGGGGRGGARGGREGGGGGGGYSKRDRDEFGDEEGGRRGGEKEDYTERIVDDFRPPHQRGEFGGGRGGRGGGGARGGRGGARGGGASAAPSGRAKPGAALAGAQRASEGIVQSQGKKITF